MNTKQISHKMKAQILQFSRVLSKYLPKVGQRFVAEMIFGIQTRQSVMLSDVARALNEKIPLKKTEERLSRQLARPDLLRHLRYQILHLAAGKINKETLLILDTSDICKQYAEKMEYLAGIHDGSHDTTGKGYWLMKVIAARVESDDILPLYMHLYSQNAPEFMSENRHITDAVDTIIPYAGDKGTWVIDRGADRGRIYEALLERKQPFIIRIMGKRMLGFHGFKIKAIDLAQQITLPYKETVVREKNGKERAYKITCGSRKVKLPDRPEPLHLVVIKGFGEEPMMLLTNRELKDKKEDVRYILSAYIKRWKIEETFRLAKQSYNLENIRVMTYQRLQNMIGLIMAVLYFACAWLGNSLKLKILAYNAMTAAKRFFGLPDFRYYAITTGIKEIMAQVKNGLHIRNPRGTPQTQMTLFKY